MYRPEAVEDGEEIQEVGARTRLDRVAAGVYRPEAVEDGEEIREVGARTRLNSKRTRPEEEDEEDMPVAKH